MTTYKCPNCTAILEIPDDGDWVKCEYCGALISLDRKTENFSAKRAYELARKTKEYRKRYAKIIEARETLNTKSDALADVVKDNDSLKRNSILYSAVIWFAICFIFSAFISDLLYKYDFVSVILRIAFWGGSAYLVYKAAKSIKGKKTEEYKEKVEQAKLQERYAKKKYEELQEGFDEDFIPADARNDAAINYIINALETEKAYTIRQSVEQWREYSSMEEKLREANNRADNNSEENSKGNSNAEVIGAFTGAALGAFGGAVAREAIKEVKRHL